jgi:glycosyltransferase involved in cell wall biosynthesis
MLDPWALQNSRWKKQIAGWLFENEHLKSAACLHALCESEAQAIRQLGLRNPICVIPNGIDLPEMRNAEYGLRNPPWEGHIDSRRKVLLYLGRIHPKKGLVNLIKAWARVNAERGMRNAEWVLAIAGWDQGGHEAELKQLATELGIPWSDIRDSLPSPPRPGRGQGAVSSLSSIRFPPSSLLFLGPQFDDAKAACYANCDAFILPSCSEGLPLVILEAWAFGKPVLMTPECNLPEGFEAIAAIRIETNVGAIVSGLNSMLTVRDSALSELGTSGLRLVRKKYTWDIVAGQFYLVFQWLLSGGPQPCFVTWH